MKRKEMWENEKRILRAVRRLRGIEESEAERFGEDSAGQGIPWGDAVVQASKGKYCASAFLEMEGGMGEVLLAVAGEGIPLEFYEAPSASRIAELKGKLKRRMALSSKALKGAKKAKIKEKEEHWEKDLEKSEKMLLQVEIAERLSVEPGCLKAYAVTSASAGRKEEAVETLRKNIKRVLYRAGGRMLKEHEIRKCFKWEEALDESVRAAEEKTG